MVHLGEGMCDRVEHSGVRYAVAVKRFYCDCRASWGKKETRKKISSRINGGDLQPRPKTGVEAPLYFCQCFQVGKIFLSTESLLVGCELPASDVIGGDIPIFSSHRPDKASSQDTPVIDVMISTRTGGTPWKARA